VVKSLKRRVEVLEKDKYANKKVHGGYSSHDKENFNP
jgi:hypothetical protein